MVANLDFFDTGLCFYCHLVLGELIHYKEFHERTEQAWESSDDGLQAEINSILERHPNTDPDEIIESYAWDMHLNQSKFPDIHRFSLVVSLYVFLEDQLNGLCETFNESLASPVELSDLNGRGVERAFLFLSKVAKLDLGKVPHVALVKDINRLRNAMVHAGGRLPNGNEGKLNKFVAQTPGLSGGPGQRVRISSEFIDYLINELTKFFEELENEIEIFMRKYPT